MVNRVRFNDPEIRKAIGKQLAQLNFAAMKPDQFRMWKDSIIKKAALGYMDKDETPEDNPVLLLMIVGIANLQRLGGAVEGVMPQEKIMSFEEQMDMTIDAMLANFNEKRRQHKETEWTREQLIRSYGEMRVRWMALSFMKENPLK